MCDWRNAIAHYKPTTSYTNNKNQISTKYLVRFFVVVEQSQNTMDQLNERGEEHTHTKKDLPSHNW